MVKGIFAFAGGIVLLQQLASLPSPWLVWSLPLWFGALFVTRRTWLRMVLCAVLGFLWAQWHAQTLLAERLPEPFIKQDLQVSGVIAGLPETFAQGIRFEFDIDACQQPALTHCPRRVRLSWYRPPDISLQPGQRWQFTVRLKPPRGFANPGSFDYNGWLLQKRIIATGYINTREHYRLIAHAHGRYPVQEARYRLQQFLLRHVGNQASEALVRALLIGDRSGMQDEHWQVLQQTGTVHLMAISGLHIGLVAGFGFVLAYWLWRRSTRLCLWLAAPRAAAVAAWCLACVYAALAGFAIPTQRALIMLAVVLLAVFLQRPVRPSVILALAALLVLLWDPFAVLAAGFWLSFAAVGLIYYLLHLSRTSLPRLSRWLRLQVALSVAMLPLVVWYFQQAPVLSPFTNLLAVPWVSLLIVPVAMLSLVLCLIHLEAGLFGLQLAITLQDILYRILAQAAALPVSVIYLPTPGWPALLLAGCGILLCLLPRYLPARYLGLVLCLPLLFPTMHRPVEGEASLTLLDVGQGLASVIMTRQHTLVFDTGPAFSERFDTGEAVVLPYLRAQNIASLDMLIISHGDNDHLGGADSLLASMPVRRVLSSIPAKLGAGAQFCREGMQWEWDGVRFELLYPFAGSLPNARENDQSCVLRVQSRTQAFLLTGDIESAAENLLVREYGGRLRSDVMVVPHHGSKTSSSGALLDQVRPSIALYPVGWLNRYRHPHPQVLERYLQRGIRQYDTAQHGAITVYSGEMLRVETYRQQVRRYWHVP